jgi:apolipoprotein N-acyltransferase
LLSTQSYAKSQKIFSDFPADILVDVKAGRTGSEQSSLLFYFEPATNRLIAEQEKIMLLPGGEYMPHLIRLFASLVGGADWLEDFLLVRGYEKGGALTVIDLGFGKVGGLLCSEIISPVLYRSLTKQSAELLINVASDSVFRGNPLLLSQNLAMAKVRAAESNRYFLQAANAGYSYIIDNRGEVLAGGKNRGNEAVFGEAKIISEPSFYAKTGDWMVVLSAALVMADFLKRKRRELNI